MNTKAKLKAIVLLLTVTMTSLFITSSFATINADSMTLSSATSSQQIGETATANSPVVSLQYLGETPGDTYSVTAILVSGPAGNTRMPVLRLIETTAAVVFTGDFTNPISLNTVINAGTQANVSPKANSAALIGAKFQVYVDSATTTGTYVVRLVPSNRNVGGITAAASQTLTITVGESSPPPDPTPSPSPPSETTTPSSFTTSLNVSSTLVNQVTSLSQTQSSLDVSLSFSSSNLGDTASVVASLVSAPAGNTSLPFLELVQITNANLDDTAKLNGALSVGSVIPANSPAYISPVSAPGLVSARFKLYLDKPKRVGTYVIKLTPRVDGGTGTASSAGLNVWIVVTGDLTSYPVRADVYLSNPGDIMNKSDASISVTKAPDSSNEVAVIRTSMKSANGSTTLIDSYTAVITGPGLIGSAPLSTDINTTAAGRAIQVRAGDAVTVYGDGTAGIATITISTYYGAVVATKIVTFVDLSNQASAILALSFSSFPEKGSSVILKALVNLPGSVRFTSNGKVLGSCARILATGSPKTAMCTWKPPVSGAVLIVATFTPSDQGISSVTTTKPLAIGRRTGIR